MTLCLVRNLSSAFTMHHSTNGFLPYFHPQQQALQNPLLSHVVMNSSKQDEQEASKSVLSTIFSTVDIPEEYREEIFRAEANTPAAKDRESRVLIYGMTALFGISVAFFNAFLTSIRGDAAPDDLSILNETGFGWVNGNPLFSFLFLNKFGGGISLITAGITGTLLELEQRTKNETAEKIYKELQRRKTLGGSPKKKIKSDAPSSRKKVKNQKRLGALAEVIIDDTSVKSLSAIEDSPSSIITNTNAKTNEGFLGKMKDFYERADNMAASQALLLNKELEDKGLIEKITDESGLRVIGKEAASKLGKDVSGDEEKN